MEQICLFPEIEQPRHKTAFLLRPYQSEVVSLCLAEMKKNPSAKVIAQLPTGCGKTVVFGEIIFRFARPTLVIAHREELLLQAKDKIAKIGIPDEDIDIVLQSKPNPKAKVWIASVQTLARGERIARIKPSLIIIDEAHHSCAATYKKVLEAFKGVPAIGFTATPTRKKKSEKVELAELWDKIIYQMSVKKAILEKWLAPIEYYKVQTGIDLNRVRTVAGDFNDADLANAVDVESRNRALVRKYMEVGGGKAVVFAVNLKHAQRIQDEFLAVGIDADFVSGKTEREQRAEILNRFLKSNHNENKVLCSCALLTEGWDCPDIRQVILARPTKSPVLYMQMLGRGTRIAPNKKACVVIDLADNYAKPGLCDCLRTVFNLRKGVNIEGNILDKLANSRDSKRSQGQRQIESEEDLERAIAQQNVEIELANILFDMPEELEASKLAWYAPREKRYFCALDKGTYLLIEDEDLECSLSSISHGNGKILIAKNTDIQILDGIARDLAETAFASNRYMWDKSTRANWSNDKPTEKQIALLAKIAPEIMVDAISKATATEIIGSYFSKRDTEPATRKQVYFLQKNGLAVQSGLTKREASKLIASLVQN